MVQLLSITFLGMLVVQLIRPMDNGETWDKILVVLAACLGASVFIRNLKVVKNNSVFLSLIAVIGILIGVGSIETHSAINGVDINKILWFGFGPSVLLLLVSIIPFIFNLYNWKTLPNATRYFLGAVSLILLPALVIANWQGGNTLMEPDSPEYVINELLAVPAGNIPYVDFIPQYGILYTWLIAPFSSFLQPNELVTLGLYLMSAGGIVAVALGVWLTYKAMNKRSLSLAILLVVPFTSLTQFPGRTSYSGSIFSTPTQIPVRMFLPLVVAMFLLSQKNRTSLKLNFAFFLLGLNLWLNTDFGMAALLSAVFVTIMNGQSMKTLIRSLISCSIGWGSYPLSLAIAGNPIDLNGFATFVRQFGGGFGSEPIQTPGPVFIILPLIISLFFASTYPLYQERFRKKPIPAELRRAVLTANFFSLWSLIGFAYYLNRSYASGQMQILFLPLSVALASYIYYVTSQSAGLLPWTARTFFQPSQWRGKQLSSRLSYLPIAMVMSLPLATIIAFPNPTIEIERLTNAPAVNKWPLLKNQEAFASIAEITSQFPTSETVYFGSSGNYVEMEYGIESANIFNSPFDLFMSQNMINRGCEALSSKGARYVVLNDTGLLVAQNFVDQKLCGKYIFDVNLPKRLMRLG